MASVTLMIARETTKEISWRSAGPLRSEDGRKPDFRSMGSLGAKHGHSAVSMTCSSWSKRGDCAAGAAHVPTAEKIMVWKTPALCATLRLN
jgi:hypothetical protein